MMTKVLEANTFNEFLSSQFEERRNRNARYSLRSFAKILGLSHSRLSEILNGQTISLSSAQSICEILQLKASETAYLLDLVRSTTGRNEKLRTQAAERVELKKTQREYRTNKSGHFLLSKTLYAPLLEYLTRTSKTPAQIATRLNISLTELDQATNELEANGFIQRQSEAWVKVDDYLKFESPAPSELIRDYHRAALARAADGLLQPIDQRKFLTFVMTIDPRQLEEARQDLEVFAAAFSKKYSESENKDGLVYNLGLQLFGL